jgi:hypothetical protein
MIKTPPPDDWDELIERFTETLSGVQETLAKAGAWEASSTEPARAQAYDAALAPQSSKLQVLNTKANEITRWVDAIESELRVSEDLLRVLLNQTEAVRQKLATWPGRAIG